MSRTISVDQDSHPHTFNLSWSTSRLTYDWWARRQHKAAISTQFVMIGVLLVAVPVIRRCIVQVLAPIGGTNVLLLHHCVVRTKSVAAAIKYQAETHSLCFDGLERQCLGIALSSRQRKVNKGLKDLKQQFLTNSHNTLYALPTKPLELKIQVSFVQSFSANPR